MKQLTRTQKLFISEYIKSLDPIKAVTFAGFSDDADKAKIASEFLSKDIIIRGIKSPTQTSYRQPERSERLCNSKSFYRLQNFLWKKKKLRTKMATMRVKRNCVMHQQA